MEELASIPQFFRRRDVLLTGGSGFVGRVLVEKLLRSCPDVGTVFLLLRPRKGVTPADRLAALTGVELFDRLREEQPGALSKVRVVAGDTTQPGLGLSAEDAEMLVERVSVVFNLAASVRFDDSLEKAVRTNVCSARSLMELAVRMPRLKALVHVSTTYCNRGEQVYDEKLYPPPADWRSVVKAVECTDPVVLRILTDKIVGEYGNTYSFTKILAEHVVNEFVDRIPIAIFRPSIVTGTAFEPIPGWFDNLYGPMGIFIGGGKGVIHTAYIDPDMRLDYVPCDTIAKGIIICSWQVAKTGVGELLIYQGIQPEMKSVTQQKFHELAREILDGTPLGGTVYFPSVTLTNNYWLYFMKFIFFDLLLAIIVDFVLKASEQKPLLVRIQRRIFVATKMLSLYTKRNWYFVCKRFMELEDKLVETDKDAFHYRSHEIDPSKYMMDQITGARRFLLKEKDEDLPQYKKRYQRQRLLHLALKTLFYAFISWMMFTKIHTILYGNN